MDYRETKEVTLYRKILEWIATDYEKQGRILDIGCATGVFLDIARAEGWQTFGVEISENAARYARDEFGLNVFAGELHEARFPNHYFDVVTACDLLEHLRDPSSFHEEVHRILKDDGLLFIQTINAKSLLNLLGDFIYKVSFGRSVYPIKQLYVPWHLHYFSSDTLRKLLYKTDYKILDSGQVEYAVERVGVNIYLEKLLSIIYLIQGFLHRRTVLIAFAEKVSNHGDYGSKSFQ